ncbi:MAG TPA: hypothetical protein VJ724_14750, partial [Tahibacter sp.]|nr:hypothetical protein [Tahibacter sp.]
MTRITDTNDERPTSAPNDTPAAGASTGDTSTDTPLRPATFTRDRRKYTRFLDPLHTGPGLQLFESPEHEAFGDGLTFTRPDGSTFQQSPPNVNYFQTAGGQPLSFGQILALAGDFYGNPSQPISDGASPTDQQTRFTQAFNQLYQEQPVGGTYQAQNILAIMQAQSDAVSQAAAQILAAYPKTQDAWSQAYSQTNDDDQFDIRYNLATGALDVSPWWASQGMYMQLAAVNWDHFGSHAVAAYQAGHQVALLTAASGDYLRAYAMEAFACHFLTDLFSSGHLRTPRQSLHTANPASDLCSRLMHDEDSYNGLVVQNANGDAWTAYGDKRLNDPVNVKNFGFAKMAVTTSLAEIAAAVTKGVSAAPFAALYLVPMLNVVTNRADTRNWSPLYVLDNDGPKVRDALDDLRCRYWTSSFLYASTYSRMPSGGIHSPGGAPPGQGQGVAHNVAWQSHRIIGSSEDDLAPAAAIVTNLDANLLNTTPIPIGSISPDQANPAMQNTLCVVFRKNSSDSSNHHIHFLAIPMTDAPAFNIYTPKDIGVGGNSTIVTSAGDPAVVALPGALLMVYPNDNGTLCQATWSSSTRQWTTPGSGALQAALLAADKDNFRLMKGNDLGPRVALCNVNGVGLFMAFPTQSFQNGGNLVFSTWNNQGAFATPQPLGYTSGFTTVYPTTNCVSLVEFGGSLVLAFVDMNNGFTIRVLQRKADGSQWTQLTDAVKDSSGQPITTNSVLSLVSYGGMLVLVVNDGSGNINTHAWLPESNRWVAYLIWSISNGKPTKTPMQTNYALSAV